MYLKTIETTSTHNTEKKLSNLLFIDRDSYTNILDKDFDLDDLLDVITKTNNDELSLLTTAIIFKTNEKLYRAFFDEYFYNKSKEDLFIKLNNSDIKYVEHYVKDFLTNSDNDEYIEINATDHNVEKKYYELIPLPNNDILVILERAFFSITTESKNKLKEFVLDCLCHQYKFNSDMELLMKLYIGLQINETYLNMVKLRFN